VIKREAKKIKTKQDIDGKTEKKKRKKMEREEIEGR